MRSTVSGHCSGSLTITEAPAAMAPGILWANSSAARGQALGSATHWVLAAALTLIMPVVLSSFAPATIFLAFFAMMVLQLLFVVFMMVETRGRSLESVAHDLERN